MFWLIKFPLRWILRLKLLVLAMLAGVGLTLGWQLRRAYATWGLVPADQDRALEGDELVGDPDLIETRSLTIHAPPAEVWPWLVQMGYGRGGWYGFEQLDRPWSPSGGPVGESSDRILPEFQDLAVGDVVPTHREGGFVARVVDADRALVLYLDDAMTREQVEEMVADADADTVEAVSRMDMPPFRVSWAFILEPMSRDRTRLVERFRASIDQLNEQQRRMLPLMQGGLFAMMRSQMMGISERVEAAIDADDTADEAA